MSEGDGRPMATYRLQFNEAFRFADAQALVPYFSRLGVTHVYASPILRARPTSTHGYDVVDPKTINPNLGGEADFINLAADLRNFGLGLMLDVVPNHMAASMENPYWRDVLTYGHSSPFARWFDIDWRMPDPNMWGRVLVPVLGESRGRVLQQDQFKLVWTDGRFLVRYFEHEFPVDPATVPAICEFRLAELKESLPGEHPAMDKIEEILARLKKLPSLAARLRRHVDIDREETEQWLAQFAQTVVQSPRIQNWVEETAERFGEGDEGRRRLKKLLDKQPYRLVHWRDAARTINYRRFFDINELVSIRQEDPQVFDETHAAVLRWVNDGLIDGLRIDHIDGLRDPLAYLERLAAVLSNVERTVGTVPVFVEKILAADEKLPGGWPVAGTTGYEFLNQAEAIFVAQEGFAEIEQQYRRMLRRPVKFGQIAAWGKRRVLRSDLSPQVGQLADKLLRLAQDSRQAPAGVIEDEEIVPVGALTEGAERSLANSAAADNPAAPSTATLAAHPEPTKRDFVEAIVEVVTHLPIYRTYVDSTTINDTDRGFIETALDSARRGGRAVPEAIDFLGEVLLLESRPGLPQHELHERVNFAQRFQQLTGPAAAKGIEDTALYAYVPLVSLNEVGGEPRLEPGDLVARLQQANEERAISHPGTMLCVTTHDTKRTADVRARLDVLSELPKLWTGLVRRWRRIHQPYSARIGGKRAPDAVAEYLFYQTVVGLWPAPPTDRVDELPGPDALQDLRERIEGYMVKAAREAKTNTSWTQNNQQYEDAMLSFVRSLLRHDSDGTVRFHSDVQGLVSRIARPGFWNSLSRTLIQYTAPGTPDLYQGDELWNFALVDPDNRRPVDYGRRETLLGEVVTAIEGPAASRQEFIRGLVDAPEDGRIKLHLIHCALATRREHPELFSAGQYIPLTAGGAAKDHIVAFARVGNSLPSSADAAPSATAGHTAIIVAPRLTTTLVSAPSNAPVGDTVWSDTVIHLPDQLRNHSWNCAFTGEQVLSLADGSLSVSQVLASFPVALLVSESDKIRP